MLSVQKELKKYASPEKEKIFQRFFKTQKGEYGAGDKFLGVTVPEVRKIAKIFSSMDLTEVLSLLSSPIHEDRLCALFILILQFKKSDEKIKQRIYQAYLKNYQYINNWDLVDTSAHHIVGAYLADKPKDILYKLAHSKNLWKKRIAIIATFDFIYHQKADETLKIANILLHDEHDLIHKAVGWMLREVGKRVDEKILLNFLDEYYKTMPRTMLRYAIERLPEKMRLAYLHGKI
jgi:3-methyladenine DNA glycosylase AlkD